MCCRILAPTYAAQFAPSFPIQVNEDARTVRVQSGITQRILLDYLANYTCASPKRADSLTRHQQVLKKACALHVPALKQAPASRQDISRNVCNSQCASQRKAAGHAVALFRKAMSHFYWQSGARQYQERYGKTSDVSRGCAGLQKHRMGMCCQRLHGTWTRQWVELSPLAHMAPPCSGAASHLRWASSIYFLYFLEVSAFCDGLNLLMVPLAKTGPHPCNASMLPVQARQSL